jgi:hypothetical protein
MAEPAAGGGSGGGGGGGGGGGDGEVKLTPKQLRLLEREKAAKAKVDAEAAKTASSTKYGELPMVRSTEITGRTWVRCVFWRLRLWSFLRWEAPRCVFPFVVVGGW